LKGVVINSASFVMHYKVGCKMIPYLFIFLILLGLKNKYVICNRSLLNRPKLGTVREFYCKPNNVILVL
jgi:hypothetical protein